MVGFLTELRDLLLVRGTRTFGFIKANHLWCMHRVMPHLMVAVACVYIALSFFSP